MNYDELQKFGSIIDKHRQLNGGVLPRITWETFGNMGQVLLSLEDAVSPPPPQQDEPQGFPEEYVLATKKANPRAMAWDDIVGNA